jgi:hypothetical protein
MKLILLLLILVTNLYARDFITVQGTYSNENVVVVAGDRHVTVNGVRHNINSRCIRRYPVGHPDRDILIGNNLYTRSGQRGTVIIISQIRFRGNPVWVFGIGNNQEEALNSLQIVQRQ